MFFYKPGLKIFLESLESQFSVEHGNFLVNQMKKSVIFEVNLGPYNWDWQAIIPNENKMNDLKILQEIVLWYNGAFLNGTQ